MYWSIALFLLCLVIWAIAWSWNLLVQNEGIKKDRAQEAISYMSATSRNEEDILTAIERFPKTVEPLAKWAEFAFDRGDFEETVKRAEVARTKFPKEPIGFALGASALWHLGRHLEAKTLINAGYRKLGRNVRLLTADGQLAFNLGKFEDAAKIFADQRRLFPTERDGYIWGADCLERLGRAAEADSLLRELIEGSIKCDMAQWLERYAAFAQDREDWAEAARRWRLAADRLPLIPQFHIGEGVALARLGDWPKAASVLDSAKILFPSSPEVEAARQRVVNRQEFVPDRVPPAQPELISSDPGHSDAHHGEAEQEAEAAFTAAEQAETERIAAAAKAAMAEGDNEKALALWTLLRQRPDAPAEAWFIAASCADAPTAKSLLNECMFRFPHEWAGVNKLLALLIATGQREEADALVVSTSERFPNHPNALHDLARLLERRNDWAGAEAAWRRFVAQEPLIGWGHAALIDALLKQGNATEAQSALDAAIKLLPNDEHLVRGAAYLQTQRADIASKV